uniref:Serine/threonine protein phosphatase PrpC n=1 Tax=Candidatus Kentrum sp. DK TaxID=2126562 RepID=A0A450S447_9GAMM|nr:MAG: Serine/threonine protein phosphatase PrpC [Candidatus Kentron sp. DK]
MYRKRNNFHQNIARAILLEKCRPFVTEEALARFSQTARVQEEIELFSQNFLAVWDHWSKEKGAATMEAAKPAEEMAKETDQFGEDGESGTGFPLAEKTPVDSALPEKIVDNQVHLREEKGHVEDGNASSKEHGDPEAIPTADGSYPVDREGDGEEVGLPNPPIEHQNHKPPPTNDKPPGVNLAKEPAKPMEKPQARFRLANATVDRDYTDALAIECPADISVTKITGLSDAGLEYDPKETTVTGRPVKPGEFKLSAQYRLKTDPDAGTWSQDFTFIVNPNPRSLWKEIPSDPNAPFSKPDNANQGKLGHGPWMLAAASRRGRSHAHVGGCRDDDFYLIASNTSGWHVLAVSDGAGSAKFSREGARIAARRASEVLADRLDELSTKLEEAVLAWQQGRAGETADEQKKSLEQSLYEAFRLAVYEPVKEIDQLAKGEDGNYRNFYTTLLLCAHKTIGDEQFVAGYWIGDGALAVYAEGEYIQLLGESDGGEYAGQTRFLDPSAVSSEEILRRIRFDSRPEISAVLLMTDGVSDPKFETDANLQRQEKWDGFWKKIKPQLDKTPEKTSKNFLDWLGFWSPGNHDDRTLAVLYPEPTVTGTTSADTPEDVPKEKITEGSGDE